MSHDTLVHQIVRPVVRVVAVRTRVTPDHLTALRLATGVGAAASFACGGAGWMLLGTCLFLASALLDRADGELARQTRRFSRHGHRWDLVADCVCTAAAFLGLGFGAAGGVLGQGSVALGVLAGAGVVLDFARITGLRGQALIQKAGSAAMNASASSSGRTAPNGPAGPQASRRHHNTSRRSPEGSGFKRATGAPVRAEIKV